ncbi:MAG: hypothetical protein JNM45_12140 [Rhizobiales bacterium]|nr:hypothetical protein [Hyphomicrobiales bacterium]
MKRLSIALAFSLLSASAAFAAPDTSKPCNAAIQNWLNGSQTTCSITDENKDPQERRQYQSRDSVTSEAK